MSRNYYSLCLPKYSSYQIFVHSCVVLIVVFVLRICLISAQHRGAPLSFGPLGTDVQKIAFGAILPKTSLITLQRQYYKVSITFFHTSLINAVLKSLLLAPASSLFIALRLRCARILFESLQVQSPSNICHVALKSALSLQRLQDAVEALMKNRQAKYNFTNYFRISQAQVVLLALTPSPTEILSTLCNQLLVKNVSTIIYMTNSESWGKNAASAQYLMQLTGYLGIPVIAWNSDNIGLEQVRRLAFSVCHSTLQHNRILPLCCLRGDKARCESIL